MNATEIDRILQLHRSAYELLRWINQRAAGDPLLLSDHNLKRWSSGSSCELWMRENCGTFPKCLRPAEEDFQAFANLFSSFLHTSFRPVESSTVPALDDWGEPAWIKRDRRKLMAGSPKGKKSSKAKSRTAQSMRELCLIALEKLAREENVIPVRQDLERISSETSLRCALILWTYFQELNRRATWTSQGDAVLELWKAMEKTEREDMNSSRILKARSALIEALNASSSRASQ